MLDARHRLIRAMRPLGLCAGVAAAIFLASCGGGGSGDAVTGGSAGPGGPGGTTNPTTPTTPEPVPTPILDSFGQVVQGMQPGDSGVDGTAAAGSALAGAPVTVGDAAGKSVSGVTDAQGYYRLRVTGFTPPLVARVTRPDGKLLFSLSNQPLKSNGFIALNITALTDKVASDVARSGGALRASELTPKIVAEHGGAIVESVDKLRTELAPVIAAAGISANNFDPLAAPFRPDHTGYDFILDNVSLAYAGDGATQVAIAAAFMLPGRWDLTIAGADRGGTLSGVPGVSIPKDAATAGDWCKIGYTQALLVGAIPLSGTPVATPPPCNLNNVVIVADGRSTVYAFDIQSYQGCGRCEAGSRIVVTYRVSWVSRTAPVPIPFTDIGGLYPATYTYNRKE
ncbi:MAG: hypothetical protein ABIR26_11025 [Ramlibacter sp.]